MKVNQSIQIHPFNHRQSDILKSILKRIHDMVDSETVIGDCFQDRKSGNSVSKANLGGSLGLDFPDYFVETSTLRSGQCLSAAKPVNQSYSRPCLKRRPLLAPQVSLKLCIPFGTLNAPTPNMMTCRIATVIRVIFCTWNIPISKTGNVDSIS
jgi:hypothetical protein